MKKAIKIILSIFLILIFISFVIFGQIKAREASKNAEEARLAQEEAIELTNMARQQAQDAAAQARMAEAHALHLAAQ
ncbi:MAG: hypothetical protein AB8B73_11840, partial [Ekhidna sp.]